MVFTSGSQRSKNDFGQLAAGKRFQQAAKGRNAERRNAGRFRAFHMGVSSKSGEKMDQRDQELLDKQLRQLNLSPRSDGVIILAILAVFFAGMTLSGFLFSYKSEPVQIASNDATPAVSLPNVPPPITRH